MQDPISDMITRIRNSQAVNKIEVAMDSSKLKVGVAEVLKSEGYIVDYKVEKKAGKPTLVIYLKYHDGKGVIDKIARESKPGLRVYKNKNSLPIIMNGLGIAIISTSKGIMSDRVARKLGCGGEVLCWVC